MQGTGLSLLAFIRIKEIIAWLDGTVQEHITLCAVRGGLSRVLIFSPPNQLNSKFLMGFMMPEMPRSSRNPIVTTSSKSVTNLSRKFTRVEDAKGSQL